MKELTYLTVAFVCIVAAINFIFFEPTIWAEVPFTLAYNGDFWSMLISYWVVFLIVLGVLYLLDAITVKHINKISDTSLKLGMWSLVIGLGGSLIIHYLIYKSEIDGASRIVIHYMIAVASVLAFIGMVFGLIAFFKKMKKVIS
ncbi:MAG: hypothetical protein ABIE94_03605 [archaeon]